MLVDVGLTVRQSARERERLYFREEADAYTVDSLWCDNDTVYGIYRLLSFYSFLCIASCCHCQDVCVLLCGDGCGAGVSVDISYTCSHVGSER